MVKEELPEGETSLSGAVKKGRYVIIRTPDSGRDWVGYVASSSDLYHHVWRWDDGLRCWSEGPARVSEKEIRLVSELEHTSGKPPARQEIIASALWRAPKAPTG